MEQIIEDYTSVDELEIRFKHVIMPDVKDIFNKIKIDDINHKLSTFIDVVQYKENNISHRVRTFLNTEKSKNVERIKKVSRGYYKYLNEYSVNLSTEIPINKEEMGTDIDVIKLKHRISFNLKEYPNWIIDVDIVKPIDNVSTIIKHEIDTFNDNIKSIDDLYKLFDQSMQYQIELEYKGKEKPTMSGIINASKIIRILKGENDLNVDIMFNKKVRQIASIIEPNNKEVFNKKANAKTLKQLLNTAISLTKEDYLKIYPPKDYLVADKADGYYSVIVLESKVGHMLYKATSIKEFKTKQHYDGVLVVEGEFVEDKNVFIVFDVLHIAKKNITSLPLEQRIVNIPEAFNVLETNIDTDMKFKRRNYQPMINVDAYERKLKEVYKPDEDYDIDGLLLFKKGLPYNKSVVYKWKPIENQTIDFYVKKCPDLLYKHELYKQKSGYDMYFLYSGIDRPLLSRMNIIPHPHYNEMFPENKHFINLPIQFSTPVIPLSYIYYHPIEDDDNDIDDKIVEMKYNIGEYSDTGEFTINWQIVKVRKDKRPIAGKEYGNYYMTSLKIFINYLDPFPLEVLYNGTSTDVSLSSFSTYKPILSFMSYVKSVLMSRDLKKTSKAIDIGIGKGNDIISYLHNNIDELLVIDIDNKSIMNFINIWVDIAGKFKSANRSKLGASMVDFTKPWDEVYNKLKIVSGNKLYSNIFVFFTSQYFSENTSKIENFINNSKRLLDRYGKLTMIVLNGELVMEKLKKSDTLTLMESGNTKYKINKLYTEKKLQDAGQKIDFLNPFDEHKQYIVNVEYYIERFKDHGMNLTDRKKLNTYIEGFKLNNLTNYRLLSENDYSIIDLYETLTFSV